MNFIWGLILIVAFYSVPIANGWSFRQGLGMLFMSTLISWQLGKKYHISVGICALVTFVLAILQCGQMAFGSEVISSIMMLLFFACIALSLENKYMDYILPTLGIIAVGDAAIMLARGIMNYKVGWYWYMKAWWVMTNGSIDACFLALMIPMVWFSFRTKGNL